MLENAAISRLEVKPALIMSWLRRYLGKGVHTSRSGRKEKRQRELLRKLQDQKGVR